MKGPGSRHGGSWPWCWPRARRQPRGRSWPKRRVVRRRGRHVIRGRAVPTSSPPPRTEVISISWPPPLPACHHFHLLRHLRRRCPTTARSSWRIKTTTMGRPRHLRQEEAAPGRIPFPCQEGGEGLACTIVAVGSSLNTAEFTPDGSFLVRATRRRRRLPTTTTTTTSPIHLRV